MVECGAAKGAHGAAPVRDPRGSHMRGRILAVAAVATGMAAAPAQAAPVSRATAIDRAHRAIGNHAGALRDGAEQAFSVRDVVTDADGASHVRFDRTYDGLRVLGGDTVVHSDTKGTYRAASLTLRSAPDVSTTPAVDGARAAAIAGAAPDAQRELVIEGRRGTPRLAWLTTVAGTQPDGTPSLVKRTVDARTGEVLVSEETNETATGSGRGLYVGRSAPVPLQTTQSGSSFTLVDATRGGARTEDTRNAEDLCAVFFCRFAKTTPYTDADDAWGTGSSSDRATAAVDVHYGSAATWDYYRDVFGRTGIAGDGKGALSRVHYGSNYDNAFWQDACFCMSYGDGDGSQFNPLVGLDVTGHEMSHGVTSHTAALDYEGESGGLNESTSDIFGTMVEFHANNPDDPPDFEIGEQITPDHTPLRWMAQPSRDGGSADCWSPSVAGLDVHYSSGVGNHFFYLLSQGSGTGAYDTSTTCGGAPAVTGIGNDAAQRIWYRALTVYMTSSTDYAGARKATLQAAGDLYGAGSAQANAVAAAWTAVNVA
jgi:zinc metalloprotease ZmpA